MSSMREVDQNSQSEISANAQLTGVLAKRPFGHTSSKWTRRFFVVRDSFLLYYSENEKKEFERKRHFNRHPKGVIPLGGCHVDSKEEPGQPFCIAIYSSEFMGNVVLAVENEFEREKWLEALKQACRITVENLELGDSMIRSLEIQGLQMAAERQTYVDKLQNESQELASERMRSEELERIREELEKEKLKMSKYAEDLQQEYSELRQEQDKTVDSMRSIEEDKRALVTKTESLIANLQSLENEKRRIQSEMDEGDSARQQLSKEKETLSVATSSLQQQLKTVEEQMEQTIKEKYEADTRLRDNLVKAELLEEEKKAINEHAVELKNSIKELEAQKAVTEAELKEEIVARLEAERRLTEAGISLQRLEKNVEKPISPEKKPEEIRQEMIGDVKTLKKFFENLAFEAKVDADKPIMIKNSLHARKTMVRRVKTMRLETRRARNRPNRSKQSLHLTMPPDAFSEFMPPGSPPSQSSSSAERDSGSDDECLPSPSQKLTYRHSAIDV